MRSDKPKAITLSKIAGLAMLLSLPAAAETIVVGKGGGAICETGADLPVFLEAIKENRIADAAAMDCTIIVEGQKVEATASTAIGQSIMGKGVFTKKTGDKTDGVFIVSAPTPLAPSPAPPEAAAPMTAGPKTYKIVDADDIQATPEKWVGRGIELQKVQVYWVADDDVRLLTKAFMTIFAVRPTGTEADLKYLKDNCETSKEAELQKCRVTVRMTYSKHGEDNPTGLRKRTVIRTTDATLIRTAAKGRR